MKKPLALSRLGKEMLAAVAAALAFAAHYGRDAAPGEAERWLGARLVRQADGSYYLPHAKKLALYAFPA